MYSQASWYMKHQPKSFDELVLPAHKPEICAKLAKFYTNGFIAGNILAYGEPGLGKTSLIEVLIHRIVKSREDIFILDRTTESIEKLKRWLQYSVGSSSQKVVKIEEMDKLSQQAQTLLKDGLMEKFQHNCTFLATSNNPEKIDPALLQRFNIKLEFKELPKEDIFNRLVNILHKEKVSFDEDDLKQFIMMNSDNSLREIITDVENITLNGEFKPFGQQPDTETPDNPQNVSEVLMDDFIFHGELQRLKEIYGISLNKEQMANELHIRATSMDTRVRDKIDLPSFQRSQGGKIIFPITAVAKFLASNLVDSE